MIISSSLGYFFFSGLSTFALLFVRGHYNVGQATSELVLALLVGGALVGTLISGWLADELLRRGVLNSRVWIPAVCYLGAAVLLIPGFVSDHLTPALWFDVAGAALLSAANPPLDAARLDIMPAGLWGRAEGVRTFDPLTRPGAGAARVRRAGGADRRHRAQAGADRHARSRPVGPSEARGLEIAFLLLLVTLAAAGIALLRARHTYPRDVATAAASNQGSSGEPTVDRPDRGDEVTQTGGSRTSRSSHERPEPRRSNRPQPGLM